MTRAELLAAVAVSCGMIVVALYMLFGVYGLLGCGVTGLIVLLSMDPIDLKKRPEGLKGKE